MSDLLLVLFGKLLPLLLEVLQQDFLLQLLLLFQLKRNSHQL